MKRSWWIAVGVIALLLLVFLGLSPSREGFISVPASIDPSYVLPEAEVNMIMSNLPSDFAQIADADQKAAYDAETKAIAAAATPGAVPAARPPFRPSTAEDRKRNIIFIVSIFKKYLHDKGKIGEKVVVDDADIDGFIATMPSHSSDKTVRTILKTLTLGVGTAVSSGYADQLAAVGQVVGYGASSTGPSGPAGATGTTGTTGTTGATGATGVDGAGSSSAVAGNAASTPPGSGGVATTTGNTTGGSSTSSLGPNNLLPKTSAMGGRGVFGPLFTALGGDGSGGINGDSSKTNQYPQLLGPDPKPSTRIEGVGVVPPSKSYTLANDGSLPSPAQLGCSENSRFLPTSRVPGDQEGTDPYRVSQSYLASRGSYKNEPVPFLTDFSAFQK